ncbi:hypothetical protein B1L02_02950 [Pseudoalteromonas piscicida]|uniref:Uncharacterized protein n=2 Tax=Pseudoalteromonas piscicida TaxID=43662 RepID=A0AAD0W4F4_PSEO7|nr:hypothetical protein B1L02_02950 [Pseudoalteromonas piscicida]AXR03199.1 hypothetical protein D0511_14810 [Pseudoalteromonas piscicida]
MRDLRTIKMLGESLISWKVANIEESPSHWHFPSFEIQEYLLPLINVGAQTFDEYGRTEYELEDCRRLLNTIAFARETLSLMSKETIRYETIHDGLASLNKNELLNTLDMLVKSAKLALKQESNLVFYGD